MIDPPCPAAGAAVARRVHEELRAGPRPRPRRHRECWSGGSPAAAAAGAQTTAKLRLLSDGDKYILRGQGVLGRQRQPGPDPAAKSWPKPYLKAATAEFKNLYF
jgi:hypothetical protein